MVGSKQEKEGIIKHGSKLINAVSNVSVPCITIMIGASYGAGNYAMMGRAYQPRFLFAWPNSKVAVMGMRCLCCVSSFPFFLLFFSVLACLLCWFSFPFCFEEIMREKKIFSFH
jgi:hypothetical protein